MSVDRSGRASLAWERRALRAGAGRVGARLGLGHARTAVLAAAAARAATGVRRCGRGPGGRRHGGRSLDADRHVAEQDRALADDEARRADVARHVRGRSELDALAGGDVPLEDAVDADLLGDGLAEELGALRKREPALDVDLALDLALDPHRALGREVALERRLGVDDGLARDRRG